METKICSKCKNTYPLNTDFFGRRKVSKDGFASCCKKCHDGYRLLSKKKNPELFKAYSKMLYDRHREKQKACQKIWRSKNRDKISKDSRGYHIKNKEKRNNYSAKYNKDNKVRISEIRDSLPDSTVAVYLRIRLRDCDSGVIKAKREQIKISRLIKQKTNNLKTK